MNSELFKEVKENGELFTMKEWLERIKPIYKEKFPIWKAFYETIFPKKFYRASTEGTINLDYLEEIEKFWNQIKKEKNLRKDLREIVEEWSELFLEEEEGYGSDLVKLKDGVFIGYSYSDSFSEYEIFIEA